MANETYTLIQKTTVGSGGAASITFSSIPQTFTDLVVRLSARGGQANVNQSTSISLNGSSSNFTGKRLYGTGSAAGTDSALQLESNGASATASVFSNEEIYIPNYTSSNAKAISVDGVTENNATLAYVFLQAGLWNPAVQAAITSVTLTAVSSSFAQYTTASLYGVAKQGVTPTGIPKASGGDIITNDGTYWIHQFLTSGTFTPSSTLSCDYLVVAGGGGGGSRLGGGGGAGGYLTASGFSVTAGTSYTATVGAGGTGVAGNSGTNGGNSVFSTITSTGGGGGGGGDAGPINGSNGGSGGGGGNGAAASVGGTATASPAQGNNGGNGYSSSPYTPGGGGGAGAVGAAGGASGVGGAGGNGLSSSITGTSVTRAGGGGGSGGYQGAYAGGAGGTGGGGAGSASNNSGAVVPDPTAGTINTGSGGGGSGWSSQPAKVGAAGGSGIVIIRYAM